MFNLFDILRLIFRQIYLTTMFSGGDAGSWSITCSYVPMKEWRRKIKSRSKYVYVIIAICNNLLYIV